MTRAGARCGACALYKNLQEMSEDKNMQDYIANKPIRTMNTRDEPNPRVFEPGDMIPGDTYSEATFAAWERRGLVRRVGEPEPEVVEAGPQAAHDDDDVIPNKSRTPAKRGK